MLCRPDGTKGCETVKRFFKNFASFAKTAKAATTSRSAYFTLAQNPDTQGVQKSLHAMTSSAAVTEVSPSMVTVTVLVAMFPSLSVIV